MSSEELQCYNKGCGQKYKEEDNKEGEYLGHVSRKNKIRIETLLEC